MDVPGTYDDLNARFVAAQGQMELFGWRDILIRLVERTDGLACPSPLTAAPTVLASTVMLGSSDLGAVELAFENGAGRLTLGVDSSDE